MKKKKYHYLYKISLNNTEKVYYGIHSTTNLNDRYFANGTYIASDRSKSDWVKSNHGKNMENSKIYNAMQKYGLKSFTREILQYFDTRDEALETEAEIVNEKFINSEISLNNRVGGIGGQFTKEIRQRISENNPMYRLSVREKVSIKQKERWTDALKKELSKNNPMYDEEIYKKNFGKNSSWYGKKHTLETREKISLTKKNQKLNKVQKEKNIEALRKVGATKFEIIDTKNKVKFNSLNKLRHYLLNEENKKIPISTLSEIINKKPNRLNHELIDRFYYTKNSYKDRNPARLFKRGNYWQMRIWINKEKRFFKKSLGTTSEEEALKLIKIEEDKFYKNK